MSLDKPKTASVILFIVLASWSIVWSGSKYVFPGLDEKDFLFYLDKQEQAEDHNIYLYSSLSLLSLHKKSIMFDVSKYPSKLVTPLITINIYPDTDIRIQSEFFDFTIWGQLGNFFNRNIEIVKLEKEILDILQKLEEINKRYKELVGSNMTLKIQVEKIITIDKMNFIDSRGENSKEKSDEEKDRPPHAKDNSRKAEPNSMIQMYEKEFQIGRAHV